MAIINSNAGANEGLVIDPTSFAARQTPYDPYGVVLARRAREYSANPSGVMLAGWNDNNATPLRTDRFGNLGITTVTPLLWEMFPSTVLNTQRWDSASTTFIQATSTSGISLNSTNLTTASAVTVLKSTKRMFRNPRAPMHFKSRARMTNYANSVCELGLCEDVSGTTQITNGVYFQITAGSVIQGVVTLNSVDSAVPITFTAAYNPLVNYTWDILLDDDGVSFLIQDTSTGAIVGSTFFQVPAAAQRMLATWSLKGYARCYNSGTAPSTAPTHAVAFFSVGIVDMDLSKPWAEKAACNHQHSVVNPTTVAQTSNWTNSTAPTSGTLSNTAAGFTTLGGFFQFAAVAGAATDYCLFGFQVPTGYTLVVKGVTIDLWNTGAAVATTPTLCVWGAANNSAAVSLATSTLTRHPLGSHSLSVGAAIGANAQQINRTFEVPLVTEAQRFFAIILRMPVATATASQVLQGMVHVDGYL